MRRRLHLARRLQELPRRLRWSVGLALLVVVSAVPFVVTSPATAVPATPMQPSPTPSPSSSTSSSLVTPTPQPGPPAAPPPGGNPADATAEEVRSFCTSYQDILDALPFDPSAWDKSLDPGEWDDLTTWIPGLIKTSWKLTQWLYGFLFDTESTIDATRQWFKDWNTAWRPQWSDPDTPEGRENRRNLEVEAPAWMLDEVNNHWECGLAYKRPHRGCEAARANWGDEDYQDPSWFDDACWGSYPVRQYDLGYNQGGYVERPINDLWGWMTNFFFDVGKTSVQFGLSAIGMGFTFDFRQFNDEVVRIADSYQLNLIGRIGLTDIFFYALIAWVGIMLLLRRAGVALGEFAVSVVMLALTLFFYDNREGYLNGVWTAMETGSYVILAASDDELPKDCGEETDLPCDKAAKAALIGVQGNIHELFIVEPYDQINWGRSLKDTPCEALRDHIISVGPHEEAGWPRRHMKREGCDKEAEFNLSLWGSRWIYALFNMIISVIVGVMLLMSGLTLLFAKFMVAVLFILAPFATPFAVLPGEARRVFWGWLAWVVQLVLAVLAISLILSMLVLGMDALLAVAQPGGFFVRWIMIVLFVIVILDRRKSWVSGTKALATTLADSLTRVTPASRHFTGGAAVGSDFDQTDKFARKALGVPLVGVGKGLGAAWHWRQIRQHEKRIGKQVGKNVYRAGHTAPPAKQYKKPRKWNWKT